MEESGAIAFLRSQGVGWIVRSALQVFAPSLRQRGTVGQFVSVKRSSARELTLRHVGARKCYTRVCYVDGSPFSFDNPIAGLARSRRVRKTAKARVATAVVTTDTSSGAITSMTTTVFGARSGKGGGGGGGGPSGAHHHASPGGELEASMVTAAPIIVTHTVVGAGSSAGAVLHIVWTDTRTGARWERSCVGCTEEVVADADFAASRKAGWMPTWSSNAVLPLRPSSTGSSCSSVVSHCGLGEKEHATPRHGTTGKPCLLHCCAHCGEEAAMICCTRCHTAWYCDGECQEAAWSALSGGHREACVPMPKKKGKKVLWRLIGSRGSGSGSGGKKRRAAARAAAARTAAVAPVYAERARIDAIDVRAGAGAGRGWRSPGGGQLLLLQQQQQQQQQQQRAAAAATAPTTMFSMSPPSSRGGGGGSGSGGGSCGMDFDEPGVGCGCGSSAPSSRSNSISSSAAGDPLRVPLALSYRSGSTSSDDAEAAAAVAAEEEEEDMCPICRDRIAHPLQMPCGHRFCRGCVAAMGQRGVEGAQVCPMCRDPMPNHFEMFLRAQAMLCQLERARSQLPGSGAAARRVLPQGLRALRADCTGLLQRVAAIDSGMMLAHYSLGLVLMDSADLRGAAVAFRAAAAACAATAAETATVDGAAEPAPAPAPQRLVAQASIAWWLARCEDFAGAAQVLRRVLRERPADAAAHYELGLVLCALQDSAGACAAFRFAITRATPGQQHTRDGVRQHLGCAAFTSLGQVNEMVGDFAAAEYQYRRALALDPGNPAALAAHEGLLARVVEHGRAAAAVPAAAPSSSDDRMMVVLESMTSF